MCRSERRGGERECGGALKRRKGPVDTFYSLCVCVEIVSKMGSLKMLFSGA